MNFAIEQRRLWPVIPSRMARELKVQYPGAIYQFMNRGDHQEVIFRGPKDRQLFLQTLGLTCEKTDWQVHAFTSCPITFIWWWKRRSLFWWTA